VVLEERRTVLTLATAYDYDRLIKALLLPAALAQKPIDQIDDGDINRFLGELMKRKGLNGQLIGPRRLNMMIARLRTMFSIAKRRKLIAEDPMVFVKNLREPKGEVAHFTLDAAERLIDAATGQDRTLITVLIFCGLRPNEALALRSEDVDFEREQLRIRRSIHRFAGIGLPKNASSEREVDILPLVVDELQEQRARTQLRGELVFLSETGGPRSHELQDAQLETNSPEGFSSAPHSVSVPAYLRCAATFARRKPAIRRASDGSHQSRNDHPALCAMVATARARWHSSSPAFRQVPVKKA
jgi:integrase